MKKVLILLCAVLLVGCAKQTAVVPETTADEPEDTIVTLGEVLGEHTELYSSAYDEERYVCVFEKDGAWLRAIANLTPEVYQALRSGGDADEELASMEAEDVEDLTAGMPKQSELDRLVGKTGGELLDDGWEIVGHSIYNDFESATVFYLVNGLYSYTVSFEEAISTDGEFIEAEAMRPLTVASVTCDGVSDHCIDLNYSAK